MWTLLETHYSYICSPRHGVMMYSGVMMGPPGNPDGYKLICTHQQREKRTLVRAFFPFFFLKSVRQFGLLSCDVVRAVVALFCRLTFLDHVACCASQGCYWQISQLVLLSCCTGLITCKITRLQTLKRWATRLRETMVLVLCPPSLRRVSRSFIARVCSPCMGREYFLQI